MLQLTTDNFWNGGGEAERWFGESGNIEEGQGCCVGCGRRGVREVGEGLWGV